MNPMIYVHIKCLQYTSLAQNYNDNAHIKSMYSRKQQPYFSAAILIPCTPYSYIETNSFIIIIMQRYTYTYTVHENILAGKA